MDGDSDRKLTRREFEAVIRRAAELATSDPAGPEGALDEAELFRIAGEVGIGAAHVRRALTEVRSGAAGGGAIDRLFGPTLIVASRVVPGRAAELSSKLDDFFVATQLLQPVRRAGGLLQYRPSVDWASQLARAASFTSRKYYIASAKSVEVQLQPLEEGRTFVEILVDPGMRGDSLAGAAVGGGLGGGGAGAAAAWGLLAVAPLPVAVGAGVLLAGSVFGAVAYGMGQSHKRKLTEVRDEIEGVLDALESGASLEPPPAAWRRWVKRNFHGVARDLTSKGDPPTTRFE
jgi:hypothetical protein